MNVLLNNLVFHFVNGEQDAVFGKGDWRQQNVGIGQLKAVNVPQVKLEFEKIKYVFPRSNNFKAQLKSLKLTSLLSSQFSSKVA